MPALENQISDLNFLSPLGFRFALKRAPTLNFFVTKAVVPYIAIGTAIMPSTFKQIPFYGDKIDYGTLDITFKVDENMTNYSEIYNWITRLVRPEDFTGFSTLKNAELATGNGLFSDATLTILNSSMFPVKEFVFIDMYPVMLSELQFSSTENDVNYIDATVTFRCLLFTLHTVQCIIYLLVWQELYYEA